MTSVDRFYHILQKPVITEKATGDSGRRNAYHFQVPLDANKVEIRQAVERLFKVHVVAVNTARVRGKPSKRVAVVLAGIAIAIGALLTFAGRGRGDDSCSQASRLTGVWDAKTRDALATHFAHSATWDAIARVVDTYAGQWRPLREAACRAHDKPAQTCLDQRFARLVRYLDKLGTLKQELALMFPDDTDVQLVKRAIFDPFEYLMHRHTAGLLNLDFKHELGTVAWQAACHPRVQNIGPKTRQGRALVPGTEVIAIERCSGHDGTYGVKKATYPLARKIAKPVETRVKQAAPQHFTSDCVMAGAHIAHGLADGTQAAHPLTLLRHAYGL